MNTNRQRLFVLLGVASSALFVFLAIRRLAWSDILRALEQSVLFPWLPLAITLYLCGHLVRGLRCQRLVSREAALTLPTATNVVVLGYAVNNVLPARLGEFARAGMLAQRSGLPYVQCLAVTVLERILDGLVLVLLLVAASLMGPRAPWITATLEVGAIVFGSAALGVLIALFAPSWLLGISSRIGQRIGPRVHDRIVALVDQVVGAVAYLRDFRSALGVLLLSLLVWLCESAMFLSLLPAFGLPADPQVSLLVMTVTNLGILVPSTPGFVGPFHFFCMRALAAFGVAEGVAFSYAMLAHLSFYVPITLWGMAILLGYGLSVSALAKEAAAARPLVSGPQAFASTPPRARSEAPEPSAFTLALLETWLPPRGDRLEAAERDQVLHATARFVEHELGQLPGRLVWLHKGAFAGFRVLTALLHFRTFCALSLERRRRWVERWAFGRFALARQMFRGPRTTALVAYYEHPLTIARLGLTRAAESDPASAQGKVIPLRIGGSRG